MGWGETCAAFGGRSEHLIQKNSVFSVQFLLMLCELWESKDPGRDNCRTGEENPLQCSSYSCGISCLMLQPAQELLSHHQKSDEKCYTNFGPGLTSFWKPVTHLR